MSLLESSFWLAAYASWASSYANPVWAWARRWQRPRTRRPRLSSVWFTARVFVLMLFRAARLSLGQRSRVPPNPSLHPTCYSGLRPLSQAGELKR